MENLFNLSPEGYINVRYNRNYSIGMLILITAFVIVTVFYIGRGLVDRTLFVIIGFSAGMHGVYALSGKNYFRYNPKEKRLIFLGLFRLFDRNVRFGRLYFVGKDLYRKINGKTRFVNFILYQCNKEDYQKFVDEVNSQDTLQGGNRI